MKQTLVVSSGPQVCMYFVCVYSGTSTSVCTVGPLLVCVQWDLYWCVYSRTSTSVCTVGPLLVCVQ